jgi:hypothetical protein
MFCMQGSADAQMRLAFEAYKDGSPLLQHQVYSRVDIAIPEIAIDYLQQPTLRLIDFINNQLLPSLSPAQPPVQPN